MATYIVCWCIRDDDDQTVMHDHWSMHETLDEARTAYAGIVQGGAYSASITIVVESTDYDCTPITEVRDRAGRPALTWSDHDRNIPED